MKMSTRKINWTGLAIPTVLICFFLSSTSLFALQADQSPDKYASLLLAHSHIEPGQSLPEVPLNRPEKDKIQLQVTEARLLCSDNDCSHHADCALEIHYHLSSRLRSDLDVGAQIMCRARLDYTTSHGYELQSERCSKSETHHLNNNDRIDSSIVVDFNFSPYEEVVEARVGAIQCNIEHTDILHSGLNIIAED